MERQLKDLSPADLRLVSRADGESVLHFAVRGGHARIAELLLLAGADPRAANSAGATPMDVPEGASPLVRSCADTLRRWVDRL